MILNQIRDIKKGEAITYDYAMSEWRIFGAVEFEDANAPKAAKQKVCARVWVCVDRIVVVSLVLHRTRYFVDVLWVARCKTDKPLTILIFLQKSKKARPAAVEENRKPSERVGAYVLFT